jgi:hypothetical protein
LYFILILRAKTRGTYSVYPFLLEGKPEEIGDNEVLKSSLRFSYRFVLGEASVSGLFVKCLQDFVGVAAGWSGREEDEILLV